MVELRAKGISETCPLCRAPLPPGTEKLYELGLRTWQKTRLAVGSNCAWPPLSASQQGEMDGAIVMLQEAMDQGHIQAAEFVGSLYFWGQAVAVDYKRAMVAYTVGAEAGADLCQTQLGAMYQNGFGVAVDHKQAVAWLEKAFVQGSPEAACILGQVYFNGQGGIVGVTPSWKRAGEYLAKVSGWGVLYPYTAT